MWEEGLLFNDNLFNGNIYEFVLSGEDFYSGTTSICVNLKSISEDYFKYLTTCKKHMDANWDPFMEKISVYSNVEGGVGIFGGFSLTTDTIVVYGEEYNDIW